MAFLRKWVPFGLCLLCLPQSWLLGHEGHSRVARGVREEHRRAMRKRKVFLGGDRGLVAKQKRMTSMLSECGSAEEVLRTVEGAGLTLDELNEINLITCIHKIGEHHKTASESVSGSKVLEEIIQRTNQHLHNLYSCQWVPARAVADSLRAIAKARELPEMQALLPATVSWLTSRTTSQMTHQEAANSLWALATIHTYCPQLRSELKLETVCDPLADRMVELRDVINMQEMDNALWAVARLPSTVSSLRETLLPTLLLRCVELLAGEDPRNTLARDARTSHRGIARVAWALALLDLKDVAILDQVSSIFLRAAPGITHSQDALPYIDVLCSFGKLQYSAEDLLSAAADLPFKLSFLRDWDIAAMAWAYQELDPEQKHSKFQAELKSEVARRKLTQAQVVQSQCGYEEWESQT